MDDSSSPAGSVALIVGVTGMVGLTLSETLRDPTTPGSPWTVYGAARRPPVPGSTPLLDRFIPLDALDRASTLQTLSPLAPHVTHLFWLALAVRDTEAENVAANSAMLSHVLLALASAPDSRLRHVALQTGTKHYMGPLVDPALVHRIGPVELPFKEDAPRAPGPNFYYALEDILADHAPRLTWTVHRSSIILGASDRSAYNALLTMAVYALICRREGTQFLYPGSLYTWRHFCDASDAGQLAAQQVWAAAGGARNEAFNCTNGDVFTWRSFWRVVAEFFGVEFVEMRADGEGARWAERMKGKGRVWDETVEEKGLRRTKLEEVTCFDAMCAVLNFGFQHVSSMNKSREFGFHRSVDSLKSIRRWLEKLGEMNIIPKVN